jgi:hypothetical protein
MLFTAGACTELRDQFIAACNGKPSCSTKGLVRTVSEIEHHDVAGSGIFADEFRDNHLQKWTEQASMP